MTRNLKVLTLAMLVLGGLGAVSAGGAQAAVQEFHCTSASTATCLVTGSSAAAKITLPGGAVVACTAEYRATIAKTTATATMEATYAKCKTAGVKTEVKMNGCDYTLTSVSPLEMTTTVTINCPEGRVIELVDPAIPCTITIGPQGPRTHIVFTNEGALEPTDLTAHVTVGGVAIFGHDATCPNGGGAGVAEFDDTVTLRGFEDEPTGEGPQVGLHVF
ncbi:MAG TPA: hypothetical protein VMT37_07475 [Solirubrobacterales bacterium]|nr:hypothetical protein [Solirubrobacterales bacterium]